MIEIKHIEQSVDKVADNVDLAIMDFVSAEKEFSGYLLGEDFKLLTEEEKETLLFVHLVIHHVLTKLELAKPFDPDKFQEQEDANWEKANDKKMNWQQVIDAFFQASKEEELLAFIEDMINDETISQLAKELIFITAKSYIEVKL